jgi:hypothetical protein
MRLHTLGTAGIFGLLLVVTLSADAPAQVGRDVQNRPTISSGSEFGYNQEMRNVIGSTRIRRPPSIASSSRFVRGLTDRSLSTTRKGGAKPFANVQRRPTLSPYLNLLRNDGDDLGGLPNYHTFVRPMLQQQRTNRSTSRQIQGLSQEVQAVNRQLAYQSSESSVLRPTGHQTVFMNFSHYYPMGR